MRTFTFSDEKSHKFWNIELKGSSFTVTYGRVGSAGTEQIKTFADDAKAQKEHDKLVKEKLSKGYVETTPTAKPAGSSQREALEEAMIADPHDQAAFAAYADLLTEAGDPRGEFIQVQLALEEESVPANRRKELQKKEKKLLDAHARAWLGDLAPFLLDGSGYQYAFARGWLDTLEIGELTAACSRTLASAPQARLLRSLLIQHTSSEDEEDVDDLDGEESEPTGNSLLTPLGKSLFLGNVRIFRLGEPAWPNDKRFYYSCFTEGRGVLGVIKKMPKLEELYLLARRVDTRQLFALKTLNNLRLLQVYHGHEYPLETLAKNPSLGNLTTLMFHPHGLEPHDEPYIRLPGLRAVVRSPHLKGLTHLHFHLSDFGDAGCTEIVKSGILKRLKVLDIALGCVSDEGARTLAACPDLRNLEFLDLRKNRLTADGLAALRATGVKLDADEQWTATPHDEMPYLWEGDPE